MSSRNVRLSPENRKAAPAIHRILSESVNNASAASVAEVTESVIKQINAVDGLEVEYYQIVDADTMQPITDWDATRQAVGCVTVYAGDVRLIDNIKY